MLLMSHVTSAFILFVLVSNFTDSGNWGIKSVFEIPISKSVTASGVIMFTSVGFCTPPCGFSS